MPAATGDYRAWGPYYRDWRKGLIQPEDEDRYYLVFVGPGFTPNYDIDQYYADLTAHELYEGDWPQGGKPIANVSVTLDTANDRVLALTHDQVDNSVDEGVPVGTTWAAPGATQIVWVDRASGDGAETWRLAFACPLSPALIPTAGPIVFTSPNGVEIGGYA